jgi:LysM repeat protein
MNKFRILASVIVFILASAFTMPVQTTFSKSGKYIVQPGDNLSEIASRLGTTVSALLKDNPQIRNPRLLHAGDRLNIPTSNASSGTSAGQPIVVQPQQPVASTGNLGTTIERSNSDKYVVAPDNNLAEIANSFGISESALLAANPQITDPSQIYSGDRIIIPETGEAPDTYEGKSVNVSPQPSVPAVQTHALGSTIEQPHSDKYIVAPGDNLSSIASRFGISEAALLAANPQITNPRLLYSGDRLIIPEPVEQGTPGN